MLATVLAAAGFYLFFARFHAPRVARADVLQARVEEMRERNDRVARLEAAGGGLEERLARYERHVARLETLIPARDEVAQLLEAVSREERRTGVAVTMMRPQPPVTEEFYERRSYELAVEGGYHAVGAFLTGVASLERIVVPDDVLMASSPGSEAAGAVLATFRMRTYVAPSEPEPAIPAAPRPSGLHGAAPASSARPRPSPAFEPPAVPAGSAAPASSGLRGAAWAVAASRPGPAAWRLGRPVGAAWPARLRESLRPTSGEVLAAVRATRPRWLQEAAPSAPEAAPAVPLVFEREVFRYPVAGRRNPFAVPGRERAVLSARASVRLLGIILHDDPRLRVAILARDPGGEALPGRALRLRTGERAGRMRLLEVAARGVVVETAGPQGAHVDTLLLPRPSAPPAR